MGEGYFTLGSESPRHHSGGFFDGPETEHEEPPSGVEDQNSHSMNRFKTIKEYLERRKKRNPHGDSPGQTR